MTEQEQMAARIIRGMEIKGLNQSQLARIMKVSRMTVSQWISGSDPKPENLTTLAELLYEGDVHYLVHGPSREPEGGFPTVPKPTPSVAPPFRRRKT